MGTFSIWHWLIVLLFIGLPIIAIKTEKSDRTISRNQFLTWIVGWVAYIVILQSVGETDAVSETAALVVGGLQISGMLVYQTLYYRLMVKRLRDAGREKTLAYVAILPIANLLIPIYLLFARPRMAEQPIEV